MKAVFLDSVSLAIAQELPAALMLANPRHVGSAASRGGAHGGHVARRHGQWCIVEGAHPPPRVACRARPPLAHLQRQALGRAVIASSGVRPRGG
jgi:hypothetical protein